MSLEVLGEPIITLGDFQTLINGLRDDAQPLGTLAAWRNFEEVDPVALYMSLDVTCRAYLLDGPDGDSARSVIDAACERIRRVPGALPFGGDEDLAQKE